MSAARRFAGLLRSSASALLSPMRMRRGRTRSAKVPEAARRTGWVDVIMPVHDVGSLIEATVRSVLAQDYWRLRLIVIDDASTDDTRERVAAWAARDSRVELLQVEHHDPNAARNFGIEHATGEYLTFLDGDDVLLAGALRDLVGSLERSGSDFAVGAYDRLKRRRRKPAAFWIDEAHAIDRRGVTLQDHADILVNAVQWTKLYRTAFWREADLRFPEGGHFQDQLVSARAYARARAFDVLARKTVSWRIRDDGSSMTQQGVRAAQVRDRFATARGALDVLAAEAGDDVRRARLAQYLSNDSAIASSELPGMDDAAFAALRNGLAALVPPADDPVWDDVPAESKVLYEFVLRGDRQRALEYIERGGLDLLQHPLTAIDGVSYVELPFWQDEEAAVPLVRFRAAPRELRAFAERSASDDGR